jgi:hypothetical protein
MDDLLEIARLGADEPPATAAELRPARDRLLTAIAAEQAAPPAPEWTSTPIRMAGSTPGAPRAPSRRRRILAVAGLTTAVAAGIAAALVLVPTASVGNHPPAATADAGQVLRQAAAVAARQPDLRPRPDQFVYLRVAGDGTTTRTWMSVDGTRDGVSERPGGRELMPGCRHGRQQVIKGDQVLPGVLEPCEPLPAYHRDLPTTPAAMLTWLSANTGGKPGDVNALGKGVLGLLEGSYVQPRSLAALYGALGRIPGMQAVPDAVDAAGRHGVGVGWRRDGAQLTLIFDPRTHVYLGSAYTAPGASTPTATSALLQVAVVARAGQLPR